MFDGSMIKAFRVEAKREQKRGSIQACSKSRKKKLINKYLIKSTVDSEIAQSVTRLEYFVWCRAFITGCNYKIEPTIASRRELIDEIQSFSVLPFKVELTI